jgi:hypothetical protein
MIATSMRRVALITICSCLTFLSLSALVRARPLPGAPRCPVFPPDSPWNQPVDHLPAAADSARLIASIGLGAPVHAGFGTAYDGGPDGIPYRVVSGITRWAPVKFHYASQSTGRYYPLSAGVPIEGGATSAGDRHVIVVERKTCTDYELFSAYPSAGGGDWTAGSGAIFNLRSNQLRPAGWTSADAAGLPILPGLARYDEVAGGVIDHALRFTAPCTARRYVYPARHFATTCIGLAPMGMRVRLKASVDISRLPRQARVIAQALKTYGMLLADNGPSWFISGAPSQHWKMDALAALGHLSGRDFQVVNTRSLPQPGL